MNRTIVMACLGVALVAIIGGCLWQGQMSERWASHPEPDIFAARLKTIALPMTVGEWTGRPGTPLDPRIRKAAGAVGDWSAEFTNERTGQRVHVFFVCGRMIDIISHTPDKCYPAAGFESLGKIEKATVALPNKNGEKVEAEFSTQKYQKQNAAGSEHLEVFWSLASNGKWAQWQSPDNPRGYYAGAPAIYKLYVNTVVEAPKDQKAGAEVATNPGMELMKEFLPQINKVLLEDTRAASDQTVARADEAAKP